MSDDGILFLYFFRGVYTLKELGNSYLVLSVLYTELKENKRKNFNFT